MYTDPVASPTGFPFKVAELTGTLSDEAAYEARPRLCDLGYLRRSLRASGRPPRLPLSRASRSMTTSARAARPRTPSGASACATRSSRTSGWASAGQTGYAELPMLTAGDDIASVRAFISPGHLSYHARDVVASLLPVGVS